MSRPTHLLLIVFVYLVGAAMALALGAELDLARLKFGILPLLLVAISIHYANEYSDVETDSLTTRTLFSGGSGALPDSDLSPEWAIAAARTSLAIGVLLSVYGLLTGQMALAAAFVLVVGAVLGWMYSLPPLALAWKGWGELDNALAGGMALPLYGFAVLAGWPTPAVVAACLPFVTLVYLNLLATTWPDRKADGRSWKKHTCSLMASRTFAAAISGSLGRIPAGHSAADWMERAAGGRLDQLPGCSLGRDRRHHLYPQTISPRSSCRHGDHGIRTIYGLDIDACLSLARIEHKTTGRLSSGRQKWNSLPYSSDSLSLSLSMKSLKTSRRRSSSGSLLVVGLPPKSSGN
jgi:1,4-dihydroxy-2-naphthoate octaprenyltransferase